MSGGVIPSQFLVVPSCYADMVNSDRYIWTLTIDLVDDEKGLWAVRRLSQRLHRRSRLFDYEPLPSSRSKTWIRMHSFTLNEAKSAALALIDTVKVNGFTAQEASDDVAARLAEADR